MGLPCCLTFVFSWSQIIVPIVVCRISKIGDNLIPIKQCVCYLYTMF
jgi:hypothetical protein